MYIPNYCGYMAVQYGGNINAYLLVIMSNDQHESRLKLKLKHSHEVHLLIYFLLHYMASNPH